MESAKDQLITLVMNVLETGHKHTKPDFHGELRRKKVLGQFISSLPYYMPCFTTGITHGFYKPAVVEMHCRPHTDETKSLSSRRGKKIYRGSTTDIGRDTPIKRSQYGRLVVEVFFAVACRH